MIDKGDKLSIRTQCKLLKLARSRIYYKIQKKNDAELEDKIACIYKSFPVYGYRRVTACLRREGLLINKKWALLQKF
jgi:putative transposase